MASLIGWNSVVDWSARLGRLNNSSLINSSRFGPSFDAVFKNLFTFDLWSLLVSGESVKNLFPGFHSFIKIRQSYVIVSNVKSPIKLTISDNSNYEIIVWSKCFDIHYLIGHIRDKYFFRIQSKFCKN